MVSVILAAVCRLRCCIDLVIALSLIIGPLIRTVPVVARAGPTLTLSDADKLLAVERGANYACLDVLSGTMTTSTARGVLQVRNVATTPS